MMQRWFDNSRRFLSLLALIAVVGSSAVLTAAFVDEYKSGIPWPEPTIITPGDAATAPSDAIVLFDGTDLSAWEGGESWEIQNGYAIVSKNSVTSKQKFGDCQLHLEFATPEKVVGDGQGRGNSGIYMMGIYEIQILDSYDNTTYFDGQCGAIYKQQPPMVNACRKPGQWQTYDIIFKAPKFADDGKLTKPAYVTLLHNGVLIHNHLELLGGTFYERPPEYTKHAEKLPFLLQDHGNPMRFRNIWVRENITPVEIKNP